MAVKIANDEWTLVVTPKSKWWDIRFREIWNYRDLLFLFVKRDFVAGFKQTLLGPFWFVLQPIFATIIYTTIFNRVAKIPTDGIPPTLFYMAGITVWNYFSDCLNKTSSTFKSNATIFGKVYFPRMIVPLSVIVSNLFKFCIQFVLFLCFMAFYYFKGANVNPNIYVLLTPILLIMMAGLGLGLGIIISSLTTKYRDLQFLLGFAVQLLMYATPIIYPLSMLSGKMEIIAKLNPMTSIVETFKCAFLGGSNVDFLNLGYSFMVMVGLLLFGLLIFSKVEKTFMDTV